MTLVKITWHSRHGPSFNGLSYKSFKWAFVANLYAALVNALGKYHDGFGWTTAEVVNPRANWTDTDWMFECRRKFR